jgi:hypothetical protein
MFPYEAVRVVLVLRTLFISSALYQFVRPVDLPLPDLSLIIPVFQGKGNDQPLFEGLCSFTELPSGQVFLDPALLIAFCGV